MQCWGSTDAFHKRVLTKGVLCALDVFTCSVTSLLVAKVKTNVVDLRVKKSCVCANIFFYFLLFFIQEPRLESGQVNTQD